MRGLTRWTDLRVTPAEVGVRGPSTEPKLRALLDVNRDGVGSPVRPARVETVREEWVEEKPLEFYVDFETVGDLDDDFTHIPERGGQPLIFMIGCGHIEEGEWRFASFTTDRITESDEAVIIDAWFDHMAAVRARLAPGANPKVIHWSPHETSKLETAFDAAVKRHEETGWRYTKNKKRWPDPNWFDFLNRVVREEPVVVRGAHGFGLKTVTNAMFDLGLVETRWEEGPADGRSAMVGAWWCQHEAERTGRRLVDLDLMRDIRSYNEIDCKAMMEFVHYLRHHH